MVQALPAATPTPSPVLEKLANEYPEESLPVDRTVYRILEKIKGKYSDEQRALDQPWQLRPELVEEVDRDALPVLLEVLKWSLLEPELYAPLTARMARWVSALAPAIKDTDNTSWVSFTVLMYARRERWAAIHGEKLDTSDLDAWVAFATWRSSEDFQLYDLAVKKGKVSPITTERTIRDLYAGQPGKAQAELERFAALRGDVHREGLE